MSTKPAVAARSTGRELSNEGTHRWRRPKKASLCTGRSRAGSRRKTRPSCFGAKPPAAPPPRAHPGRRLQEGSRHQGVVDAQIRGVPTFAGAQGGGEWERSHPKASKKGIGAKGIDFGGAAAPARGFPRILAQTPDPASNHQETPTVAAGDQRRHGSEQIGRRRRDRKSVV